MTVANIKAIGSSEYLLALALDLERLCLEVEPPIKYIDFCYFSLTEGRDEKY